MPAAKTLVTGPFGAAVRDRVLGGSRVDPSDLWLVPSGLARVQVLAALGRASGASRAPRVWCWSDLWRAVREARADGPARLSDAAARAALGLAIDRARDAGRLSATSGVVSWPGFRRRLRARVAAWTRAERPPGREPPEEGPAVGDEWEVFGQYRAILKGIGAEDADGFAAWASRELGRSPAVLRRLGTVTVFDPEDDSPAVRRALDFFEARARAVRVTLACDPEPALAEVFSTAAAARERLLGRGYVETAYGPELWRPAGLRDVERELFRSDAHARPPVRDASGLTVLGGPKGDGVGLLVAREVRRLLHADRVAAEDVLVLVRAWDEDAEAVVGVLRSWGLPVSALGCPRPLANEPAVSALRMALRLPVEGWDAASVVRLLRHGRFRPGWDGGRSADARARAASAVRDAGVYRGRDAIRNALDRAVVNAREDRDRLERAAAARGLVDRLIGEVEVLNQPGTWADHVARLHRLARSFGIDGAGDHAVETFWNALDDHAAVTEAADREPGGPRVAFAAFVEAVEGLVGDVCPDDETVAPGSVVVTTVDRASGARARFVVLANLAEGTFPTREAVEAAEDPDDPSRAGPAFAREMARFLRVLGSADHGAILAYPTRDEKGQDVLAAGFLDDLVRRVNGPALQRVHESHARFDPALIDRPDLALAPADARVRALALACAAHQPGDLTRLAADPRHRRPLDGAASAVMLLHHRLGRRDFNAHDGRLDDPEAARALAERFGPEYAFSPSQLESFLFCRFQFFVKYVLGLKLVDDRDELDEDFIGRGNRVHKLLEELEQLYCQQGGDRRELVVQVIQNETRAERVVESEADHGLHAIERRRAAQALERYARQAIDYERKSNGAAPEPRLFEVVFGDHKGESPHPCLTIGDGPGAVRVRGTIDRVDVIETPDGTGFRVIDYKTGACPSKAEVKAYRMVQLPLYALAVERLALAGDSARLHDVGYWDLKAKGFDAIPLEDWAEDQARLEAEVIAAVGRLRRGLFEVYSDRDDCTRTCDYKSVCRVGEVRSARKSVGRDAP